jgi:hypothetical protein
MNLYDNYVKVKIFLKMLTNKIFHITIGIILHELYYYMYMPTILYVHIQRSYYFG